MAKQNYQKPSQETLDEALKIAKGTQRPGQTKEQTKLIAQGIQKGIDLYKKQQKARARELNRKLKKVSSQPVGLLESDDPQIQESVVYHQHRLSWLLLILRLSWLLLILTWLGIGIYLLV